MRGGGGGGVGGFTGGGAWAGDVAAGKVSTGKRYDLREFEKWIVEEFEPSVRLAGPAGNYVRQPGQTAMWSCMGYRIWRVFCIRWGGCG